MQIVPAVLSLTLVGIIGVGSTLGAASSAPRELSAPADIIYAKVMPGRATAIQSGRNFVLANNVLEMGWSLEAGHLRLTRIADRMNGRSYLQSNEVFEVQLDNRTRISSSACQLVGSPTLEVITPVSDSACAAMHLGGWKIAARFKHEAAGLTVQWNAELRDGSHYVRQILRIEGAKGTLSEVNCLETNVGRAWNEGSVLAGNPVCNDHLFMGQELPMSKNVVKSGVLSGDSGAVSCGLSCKLPLQTGKAYEFSSVLGAYPEGQRRRAFLRYLERERARPYRQFLHYNCWFDLHIKLNEQDILKNVQAFTEEMTVKRGVAMDSYVLDDGWDNPREGFWTIDRKKFPSGFDTVTSELDRVNSHMGIWISPLAGYAFIGERVEHASKLGLVRAGSFLDLSYAPYYEWFRDFCANMVKTNKVNYFKWDKAGEGASPHFMALLSCARELRQIDPNLFFNVTVGTWASPFWLNVIDSTWRGGEDVGWDWTCKGNDREKWLNYRDGVTYRNVVKAGPLYPLNSIMNHGIVHASLGAAGRAAGTGTDLRNEARSYFGSGTALQELYIQPSIMTSQAWDTVAAAAKWARLNADVLVDTHWVGGDPTNREIYGWASWTPQKATLTLRNPDDQPREITLDAVEVFELPSFAAKDYVMTSPYADQRIQKVEMKAGNPSVYSLQPFEVLVLESSPTKDKYIR
jgi:hypothetical protein